MIRCAASIAACHGGDGSLDSADSVNWIRNEKIYKVWELHQRLDYDGDA